jgi:hypothetical protein
MACIEFFCVGCKNDHDAAVWYERSGKDGRLEHLCGVEYLRATDQSGWMQIHPDRDEPCIHPSWHHEGQERSKPPYIVCDSCGSALSAHQAAESLHRRIRKETTHPPPHPKTGGPTNWV